MADTPTADVAGSVRAELARAKISRRQMARDLGMTHTFLNNRLSGETKFRADELVRIASYLDLPIERLFEAPAQLPATPTAAAS